MPKKRRKLMTRTERIAIILMNDCFQDENEITDLSQMFYDCVYSVWQNSHEWRKDWIKKSVPEIKEQGGIIPFAQVVNDDFTVLFSRVELRRKLETLMMLKPLDLNENEGQKFLHDSQKKVFNMEMGEFEQSQMQEVISDFKEQGTIPKPMMICKTDFTSLMMPPTEMAKKMAKNSDDANWETLDIIPIRKYQQIFYLFFTGIIHASRHFKAEFPIALEGDLNWFPIEEVNKMTNAPMYN